ncbi:MAG TPA: hypothetical protein DCM73_08265 [Clostridiales bacterium]|nr:hypothetical protein [Clostridiales bacterium]
MAINIPANVQIEGQISSNYAIESLNTKIYQDVGSENHIIIDVKGIKNSEDNQDIISTYDQIISLPINIKKNTDSDKNLEENLIFEIQNLGNPISCFYYEDLSNNVPANATGVLKHEDIFTITYNGDICIIEGHKPTKMAAKTIIDGFMNNTSAEIMSLDESVTNLKQNKANRNEIVISVNEVEQINNNVSLKAVNIPIDNIGGSIESENVEDALSEIASQLTSHQSFDFDNLIPMQSAIRNTEIIKENNTTTITETIVHKGTLIKIADRITIRDGSNVIVETTKFYGDDGETIIKQTSIMTTINPDKSITEEVV